jgi:hypothetical protein
MFWSKRKKQRPAVKLNLECLESRIVPNSYVWNPHPGGDGSSWDDGNNWQNTATGFWGNVPGASDTASVRSAGYTIFVKPTDNVSIGQLNWTTMGSSLVVLGTSAGAGSLTFGPNQSTIAGDVTDYGNINAASSADVIFSGGIYVGGGGYTGGNLTGTGTFEFPFGSVITTEFATDARIGAGGLTLNFGSGSPANVKLDANLTLPNGDTATLDGTMWGPGGFDNEGTFNWPAGLMAMANGFVNHGVFTGNIGAGSQTGLGTTDELQCKFVNAEGIGITCNWTGDGDIYIAPGGLLENDNDILSMVVASLTIDGDSSLTKGVVNFGTFSTVVAAGHGAGVVIEVPFESTGEGELLVNGNAPSGANLQIQGVSEIDGTVTCLGTLLVSSGMSTANGFENSDAPGKIEFINGGQLTINGGTVDNLGTISMDSTTLMQGAGEFYNDSGSSTLNLFTGSSMNIGKFTNSGGTVGMDFGNGNAALPTITANTVRISGGTLNCINWPNPTMPTSYIIAQANNTDGLSGLFNRVLPDTNATQEIQGETLVLTSD